MSVSTFDANLISAVLGTENVLTGAAAAEYAVNGVLPAAVAVPGTRQEVAAVVDLARAHGWALVPCGGGTQLHAPAPPRKLDLVLSTRRLDRVVDYQPDDMTITVEPGVTVAALQQLLAGKNQFLPLNPALPHKSTVGGMVAAAGSGPWRAGHGTPRDWVIGIRVVGADGKEVRGGGQVVKNVAGYDLPKLYTGSWGTLGVITEITFKVMPQTPARGYCRVALDSPEQVEKLLARVMHSDLQPAALELANGTFLQTAGLAAPVSAWSLVFEFQHVPEAVDWQVKHLAGLAAEAGGTPHLLPADEGALLLEKLRDLPAVYEFAARLGTVSSRVATVAAGLVELDRRHGSALNVTAHAATGQVFAFPDKPATAALAQEIRALAGRFGATCVFPRHAGMNSLDPWGKLGPETALMKGIKQSLDPTGIFSPGRFIGGI